MKRRPYRLVSVKQVSLDTLREAVAGARLIVGVDAAKTKFAAALMDGNGDVLQTVGFNHPAETQNFVELLLGLGAATVQAAIESTGSYSWPVVEQLRAHGVAVYRVSTKHVHDASELYDGVPSQHDAKAAGVIAQLHYHGRSAPWLARSDWERNISALLSTLKRRQRERQASLNELEAVLAAYWPELSRLMKLESATLLGLVARYGSAAAVAQNRSAAEELMRQIGGVMLTNGKILRVLDSAAQTMGVAATVGEAEALRQLGLDLLRLDEEIRRIKLQIHQLTEGHAVIQRLSSVVGETTAAILVSEVGDPSNFPNASSYLKAAGLNLKECSSGEKRGMLSISKRGSSKARQVLYLNVLRLVQQEPLFAAWHASKVEREGGVRRCKSIVALMRKLVKALWHVAHGAAFDATKLFDARRLAPQLERLRDEVMDEGDEATTIQSLAPRSLRARRVKAAAACLERLETQHASSPV